MSAPLTIDTFRSALDDPFAVLAEGVPPLHLALVEVRGLGRAFEEREAFALLFRGPSQPALPQATYRLAHPDVGEHDVFMVPVGAGDETRDYEAIFT